ncbi:tetrahydrofolate dehydrogenase/cyclohydrolase, NAD(P)-binding domain protein [Aedoeadaptatus coxii]|uniref:bifunctional 5,10-methylenetetrahydrofolate dehydrogenase/5,10-methenyltetrahydrofolate cyclohydrolase n=1 Tax=Aedoeadaptatus coxii TaxID=755172 RepID=UPI001752B2CA|nr:bifunctional 5,10-methylenetetrahydrofolate dehydrogenase/5,10-methenyltetrahydrofolate cyclohydrolase [Peptoniphilus coxii]CAC9930914.1 tetrahydrofolate dehydrogenase/cyclohydrolase, NAD(P)-binding domain protein [Peptoniphilus coxii]
MKYDISPLRDKVKCVLKDKVERARERQMGYKLLILRVGDNKADISYENSIKKSAESVGIEVEVSTFAELVTESEIIAEIKRGNLDDKIGGILLFHPLPKHLDADSIDSAIDSDKDIDCLSPSNQWKVFTSNGSIYPATAKSALLIAKDMMDLKGKRVLIINRSMVIGKPLAMMMLDENATVTIGHSKTQSIPELAKGFDLVVYGTGQCQWVDESFVSKDQCIIDCGIAFTEEGKMVGDVNFDRVVDEVNYVTSVPGGVGSLTNLLLLDNMFQHK